MMKAILSAIVFLFFMSSAQAFQCSHDHTLEKAFERAERGFLIYVTETRLEEGLLKDLTAKYPEQDAGDEYVKLLSAGYRVIEEFKGDSKYQPRLIDLLGIGIGFVGLMPGQYYLVLLPPTETEHYAGMRRVDICTVPLSHYRLQEEKFQNELEKVRKLRDH